MKCDIYFNLHKLIWSVRDYKSRLVVKHCNYLQVKNASFIVSDKGRERVRRERRKNVHAFVRGEAIPISKSFLIKEKKSRKYKEAYYNPYTTDYFIDKKSGEKLVGIFDVLMDADSKTVWYRKI